jgi:hypothetical protein
MCRHFSGPLIAYTRKNLFPSPRRRPDQMCRNPGVLTYEWTKNGGRPQMSSELRQKFHCESGDSSPTKVGSRKKTRDGPEHITLLARRRNDALMCLLKTGF